jgi:hypothetical protein
VLEPESFRHRVRDEAPIQNTMPHPRFGAQKVTYICLNILAFTSSVKY